MLLFFLEKRFISNSLICLNHSYKKFKLTNKTQPLAFKNLSTTKKNYGIYEKIFHRNQP